MKELYSKDYGYKKVFVYKLDKPIKHRKAYKVQKDFYIKSWRYYDSHFHKMDNLLVKHNLEVLSYLRRKKLNKDLEYFDTILVEQDSDLVVYSICYWLEDVNRIIRFGCIFIDIAKAPDYIEDLKSRGY